MIIDIPKVNALTAEDFQERFVRTRTPVVVRSKIAECADSLAVFLASFGDQILEFGHGFAEYFDYDNFAEFNAERREQSFVPLSISEYFSLTKANPRSRLICSEKAPPEAIDKKIRFPDILNHPRVLAGTKKHIFVGNQANIASLHFDADQRHVLHSVILGRKTFYLIEPEALTDAAFVGHLCLLDLRKISAKEKLRFLSEKNAYRAHLEPGDAIYIPSMMNHFVEYDEDSVSVNFRFATCAYKELLAKYIVPSQSLQLFSASVGDHENDTRAMIELLKIATDQTATKYQRFANTRDWLNEKRQGSALEKTDLVPQMIVKKDFCELFTRRQIERLLDKLNPEDACLLDAYNGSTDVPSQDSRMTSVSGVSNVDTL